jgi:hypothetical protein
MTITSFLPDRCKAACLAVVLSIGTGAVAADEAAVPEPFRGDNPTSAFSINYNDWDLMLEQTVLPTGRSDRAQAPKARPRAGSRIIRGSSNATRLEGNRVDFHAYMGDNLTALRQLRDDLAKVPDVLPLRLLNRDEQLAYWLNLYNATLVAQIAEIFPETNLRKFYPELWEEKVLTVSGKRLSLNDIHHRILIPKYRDPRIMYGLFQGVIGGPNLPNEAYEGHRVWRQLEANAHDFINSNRGALVRERILRASYFYEINSALFPDFNRDVRRHILQYANPHFADKVMDGSTVVGTGQSNWYIADLYGGNRSRGSANTNPGAFLLAFRTGGGFGSGEGNVTAADNLEGHAQAFSGDAGGYAGGSIQTAWYKSMEEKGIWGSRFPTHVVQYLRKIGNRKIKQMREGEVSVEEFEEEGATDPASEGGR